MRHAVATRRAALAVLAALVLGPAGGGARAQDPQASVVQNIARDWLALTDIGDAMGTWRAAGRKFRDSITPDRWEEALRSVREPFGPIAQRSVRSTQFAQTIPDQPPGDYALVVFRSGFERKSESGETVTLEREADGRWRVIGYFIR